MMLMNRISVKSRMLTLVFLPLLVLCALSGIEIRSQMMKLNTLNTLNHTLQFNHTLAGYITTMHQQRLNILYGLDNGTEYETSKKSLGQLAVQSEKQETQSLSDTLSELQQVNTEITQFSSNTIEEWSSWITDVVQQTYQLKMQIRSMQHQISLTKKRQSLPNFNGLIIGQLKRIGTFT